MEGSVSNKVIKTGMTVYLFYLSVIKFISIGKTTIPDKLFLYAKLRQFVIINCSTSSTF